MQNGCHIQTVYALLCDRTGLQVVAAEERLFSLS